MTMSPTLATRAPVVARRVLAAFLVAHGVAHFVGTTGALDVARDGAELSLFGGAATIGGTEGLVVLAMAWAVVGLAYVGLAAPVWRGMAFSGPVLLLVTGASLALSVVGLWTSAIGVVIDLVLLALVARAPHLVALRATS